jgi:asparagine synthase (glutamine-hydrolysing)
MWVACFDRNARHELYTREFAREVETYDVESAIRSAYEASNAPTLVERLLDVDTQTYLPDQLLVKTDIASMAHSLEVRSPLLDHCFMEVAARLPLPTKVSRGSSKRLLKDAVRRWIPDHVLDRPKCGFSMPLSSWLRNELRHVPSSVLLDRRAVERGLFRRAAVERLIKDHQRGVNDNGNKLWALIQLELWFRTYVDVEPTGPISLDLSWRQSTPNGRSSR